LQEIYKYFCVELTVTWGVTVSVRFCQKSLGGVDGRGLERGCPPPHRGGTWEDFFHFKIVHSGTFSYANSKVLYAIKCRERYVITVFLVTDGDTDIRTSVSLQTIRLHKVFGDDISL